MRPNQRKLLLTLPMLPLLMGTTALLPECKSDSYKDFKVAYVGESLEGTQYTYTYRVTNTGTGYIDGFTLLGGARLNSQDDPVKYTVTNDLFHGISYSCVIPPNEEIDVHFSLRGKLTSGNKVRISATAFNDFADDVKAELSEPINVIPALNDEYYCDVPLNYSARDDSVYNYGAILKAKVEGKEYYFFIGYYQHIYLISDNALHDSSVTDATIVKVVRSKKYGSSYNPTYVLLLAIAAPFVIAAAVIATGIIVPIAITSAHKKKRNNNK